MFTAQRDKRERQFNKTSFHELQKLKHHSADYFLGLIAKLAFVSGGSDIGTTDVNDFDFDEVGISVSS